MLRSIIFAIVAMAFAIPAAQAAECNPQSDEELLELLVAHSPFEGEWKLRQYSGPSKLVFKELAGVPYVVSHSSDERGRWGTPAEYVVSFLNRHTIRYDTSNDSHGAITLKLGGDCQLDGTQDHKNGLVSLDHDPAPAQAVTASTPSGPFGTKEELITFLLEGSPFEGPWIWADREGRLSLLFEGSEQGISSSVTFVSSSGDAQSVHVSVVIHTPSLLGFRTEQGTLVQLMVRDNTLRGVIVTDEKFALLVTLEPSVRLLTAK